MNPLVYRDKASALKSIDIFKELDDKALASIPGICNFRTYRKGHVLFQSGDECRGLYILISGGVCLYFISEDGNEVIFSELGAGDVIGEIELTLGYRHTSNATVSSVTKILEIDRKTYAYLSRIPEFSTFLMRTFARKLHDTMVFAEGMALYPIETRLARLLMHLGQIYGKDVGDGILIEKAISQSRMGQLINASRPRVNIQLQAWKSERLIDMRQNRIVIIDQQSLKTISRPSGRVS